MSRPLTLYARPATVYLRALVSVAATLALVVGLPYLLVVAVGWPLPRSVPAPADVGDAFARRGVTPEVLINVLAVIVWLAWAQVVWALVTEVVALARGRVARRAPVLPGIQLLAGRLVAGMAVVVSTMGPVRAVGAAPLTAPAAEAAPLPFEHTPGQAASPSPAPAAQRQAPETPPHIMYETVRGDTFWRLAQEHLGDGTRWREIRDLNAARAVAPGRVLAPDEDRLHPGWRLLVPVEPGRIAPGTADVSVAAVAARLPSAGEDAPGVAGVRADQPGGVEQIVVTAGDNLWKLAESRLQQEWGRQPTDAEVTPYWRETVVRNEAVLRSPDNPDLIFPGQQLVLPPPPADPLAPPAGDGRSSNGSSESGGPATDGSSPGAGAQAGDAEGSGEARSDDREPGAPSEPGRSGAPSEPGGAEPDVARGAPSIDAETPERAPSSEPGAAEPDGAVEPDVAGGAPSVAGESPVPPPPSPDGPGGGTAADASDTGGDGAAMVSPGDAEAVDDTEAASDDGADEAAPRVPIGLVGGGIATAGLLLLLERRRRAQQRRRRPGRRVAMPRDGLAEAEQELRGGASIEQARLVDAALRAAAAGSGVGGMPELRWVEATAEHVTLTLAGPAPAPPVGFVAESADRWRSDGSVGELMELGSRAASLAPALVPVGTTAAGAEVLIDLEASGVITVAGPPGRAVPFLRGVAVAAATVPWIEQPRVLLVGMSGELTVVPWVEAIEELDEALAAAQARVARVGDALRSLGHARTSQARAAGATPDAWEPLVVISAHPPGAADDERLQALATRPGQAVAVMCPPGEAPRGRLLTIEDDGWLRVDDADEPIRARLLDERDARVVAELLDVGMEDDIAPEEAPEPDVRIPLTFQFAARVHDLLDEQAAAARSSVDVPAPVAEEDRSHEPAPAPEPAWDEAARTPEPAWDEAARTPEPAWDEAGSTREPAWDEAGSTREPAWDEAASPADAWLDEPVSAVSFWGEEEPPAPDDRTEDSASAAGEPAGPTSAPDRPGEDAVADEGWPAAAPVVEGPSDEVAAFPDGAVDEAAPVVDRSPDEFVAPRDAVAEAVAGVPAGSAEDGASAADSLAEPAWAAGASAEEVVADDERSVEEASGADRRATEPATDEWPVTAPAVEGAADEVAPIRDSWADEVAPIGDSWADDLVALPDDIAAEVARLPDGWAEDGSSPAWGSAETAWGAHEPTDEASAADGQAREPAVQGWPAGSSVVDGPPDELVALPDEVAQEVARVPDVWAAGDVPPPADGSTEVTRAAGEPAEAVVPDEERSGEETSVADDVAEASSVAPEAVEGAVIGDEGSGEETSVADDLAEEPSVAPGAVDGAVVGDERSADEAPVADEPAEEVSVGGEATGRGPVRLPPRPRVEGLLGEADVLVRVLGEVEAVRLTPDGEERLTPSRQKALEAITYLAVRDGSVDREDLETVLFPTGANAIKTFHNAVAAARTALGEELFPAATGGRYELSDRVVTDYALVCELANTAEVIDDAEAAAELLSEALTLVRGEPFVGAGRGYSWVAPHRSMIVAQVVDIAEEVAEVRLATGDWRGAEWAARQGLRAFPCDERMYRLLMRAAHVAGNTPGVQRIFRELCDTLADPDGGVEPDDTVHPETVALLEQLTGAGRHGRASA